MIAQRVQRVENCKCDSIPRARMEIGKYVYTIFCRGQVFDCQQVNLSVVDGRPPFCSVFPIFLSIFLKQSVDFSPASFRQKVRFASDLSSMVNLTKYKSWARAIETRVQKLGRWQVLKIVSSF